jgi:hypothetical protein
MLKLYKKYLFIPHYLHLTLFLAILILGLFTTRYHHRTFNGQPIVDEVNFYELVDVFIFILTISQIITFAFIYKPLIQLANNILKKPKLFASLTAIGYAILATIYIFIYEIELSYWNGQTDWWGNYHNTNLVGRILILTWQTIIIISILLSLINLFVLGSLLSRTEKTIQKSKSKIAKEASNKIRELKKLLDEGIISKEVFDEKSKKYIEEL